MEQWADAEVEGGYYEYVWAGTREQVEGLVARLPEGSAVAMVWSGPVVEGYPEATIVRFRSPVPVEKPEWAARVAPALARATVGVFAGT